MWRFKPFMHKEQTGLEGRILDVGNLKIHVQKAVAEGGFSCVYLARDFMQASRQYALKRIICNDNESLALVKKEVEVMKSLKGHPNVVTLYSHSILDMGRTKEALLVMEFCDKSLVSVLENRGSGYFDEKQVFSIFRDVCNAIFAMHCPSPPIAHRDLKAENILLGADGLWKLCDFGSTSTNHKRFEKPEEMGVEEDNIRKHTTPAYRAPEICDLFRRELINEKVDIWALGCLLFRICYFKNAFNGESKLQVLNGNYCIPELPKYSLAITDLIKDMLQASPNYRPDITQVWFRVNGQLPVNLQKSLPDRPPQMQSTKVCEGSPQAATISPQMPHRSPPPLPSAGDPTQLTSKAGEGGGQLGAFWSTLHAKDSRVGEKSESECDETASHLTSNSKHDSHPSSKNDSLSKDEDEEDHAMRKNSHDKLLNPEEGPSKKMGTSFFKNDTNSSSMRLNAPKAASAATFQDDAFNTFIAEFDAKISSGVCNNLSKQQAVEAEVKMLKEQLTQANLEKFEMTSKFEKLSAICRSQRQEIQEFKQVLAARTPSPTKDASRNKTSSSNEPTIITPVHNIKGTIWEVQQEKANWGPEPKTWQAFAEEPKTQQSTSVDSPVKSVRTRNSLQNKQATHVSIESFKAVSAGRSQTSRPVSEGNNNSQRFGEVKSTERKSTFQPAGWAGF